MKKGLIGIVVVAVLLIGAIIALATVDFNRMGKENAYYQIPAENSVEETKLDSGEIIKRYLYTGTAFFIADCLKYFIQINVLRHTFH